MIGNPDVIQPGCYMPGCNEEHPPGKKFCPKHGGTKVATKKAAPKKSTKRKALKGKSVGRKPGQGGIDWTSKIAHFLKLKSKEIRIEMGSPGSAQVSSVRLRKRPDTEGIRISTESNMIVLRKEAQHAVSG